MEGKIKRMLVVGGANGIGLSIATLVARNESCEKVYIVDRVTIPEEYANSKFEYYQFDLTIGDFSFFDRFADIDALMITAGFGHLSLFRNMDEEIIDRYFKVNVLPTMRLIKRYYPKLESQNDFYCGVMGSIAGFMSSPFYSVYGATKAALKIFIESVNVELLKGGSSNCILNVAPGSIKGTSFTHGKTNLSLIEPLALDILDNLLQKKDLFIPQYEEVFSKVLERYHVDFRAEGIHSYEFKVESGRATKS